MRRPMNENERANSVIRLKKSDGKYVVADDLAERISSVLGPLDSGAYVASAWMKKFFLRYRMICKTAAEKNREIPTREQFLVSFLEQDRKECEQNIKAFYDALGMKEPALPAMPYECYDVNEPIREYFSTQEEYEEAVRLYPQQKEQYERSVKEWKAFEDSFTPQTGSIAPEAQEITIQEKTMKTSSLRVFYKYDFEKNTIEKYTKKVQDVDETIRKAEAADVSPLTAFFKTAKELGLPLCFYGAGGAASPSNFATQLANEQGLVAMTLTPMAVMSLSREAVSRMCFLAISASGGPVDMQSATEYLLSIAPERVYCLTTNAIDHKSRFGQFDNKVGQMVKAYAPEHAICVNLSIHSDGFVGTNKHVGLSLLLYRAFHPEETGFVEKLLLPEVEPYEMRLPEGCTLGNISDLHILYGTQGRAAANDMEGRMLEAGVLPAMATDMKNFTHGRHVFLDKHPLSAILMLLSPRDERFAQDMLKLIPKDRPLIIIRTPRNGMLGALQLMIRTFYLSIDICAPRNINPYSPGAPSWGGKLWALKIQLD